MDVLKLVVGPLVGAFVAGGITLALAVFGPGRYRGWQLQKLLDLIAGMADLEEFSAQRAALVAEADSLARKVAAMHKVPTDWTMFVIGVAGYGSAYGAALTLPYWGPPPMPWPLTTLFWAAFVLFLLFGSLTWLWATQSHNATKAERVRFISEGLPADFKFRESARPPWMPPRIPGQAVYRPPKRESRTDSEQ